jgi:hypothetical protein
MAATALIVFDQGGPGTAGQAFSGSAGSLVTISNDNNTDVTEWEITLLDVPPNSALVPGVLASAVSGTPSATFTPDVPGSYRIKMDLNSEEDIDIRNFGVPNARGIITPPFQELPEPLPILGSGKVGEKPDEQNYGGQARGWTGDRSSGQMEQFFQTYDDLLFTLVTTTPYNAPADNHKPLYVVDLDTIGGPATFNLPSGARTGQRFKVLSSGSGTDILTVALPGSHSFQEGSTSVDILTGGTGEFVFLGSISWLMLGVKYESYERSITAGVESTQQTGFSSIGTAIPLNPADFVNSGGTASFKAVLETTDAADAAEIRLFNLTTLSAVVGSVLSTTSLTPVLVSASVTLASGVNLYEAQLRLQTTGSPNRATCKQAQLEISWFQT